MTAVADFLKKHNIELQIVLLLIAAGFLSFQITRPLVDYDEATYAKVIVDTLKSADIWSFTLSGHHWFEKPPLYLWLAMAMVKVFGAQEFAFRLPSIFASILCLWLIFLIIKELTGNRLVAAFAFLVLLFSPPFYFYAKEVRLDSSVLMAMLAALFFCIRGWQKDKFLFWVFPAVAVGFLFKSFVVVLIVPIILIYSFFYSQWLWLKNRHLWTGFLASLILLIPWHIIQFARFGSIFWNDYFWRQVYQRSVSTITGTNSYYDYARYLRLYYSPWFWMLIVILILFLLFALSKELRSKIPWKHLAAPLFTALLILGFFTPLRTHLSSYILPVFPFLAMFIAVSFLSFSLLLNRYAYVPSIILLPLVVVGVVQIFTPTFTAVMPYAYEEVVMGQIYKNQNNHSASLYSLDWRILETLNYYGDTSVQYLAPSTASGKKLKAPFYMVTTTLGENYFFYNDNGTIRSKYENLKLLYQGQFLVLMYSNKDLQMPIFSYD